MENQVRELNTYMLISILAAHKGYRIYIGTHYSIIKLLKLKKSIGGIFINKGSSVKYLSKFIKKKCDKLVIIDQEISPGYSNLFYDFSVPARHYEDTLLFVDRYYCVNDIVRKIAQKTLLKENKKLKIVSVGWPRFDIMNHDYQNIFINQIKKLNKKYSNFILFNSDFGLVSKKDIEIFDGTNIFRKADKKFIKKNNKIKKNFRDHAIKDFNRFKIFLLNIANKIGNKKIVIRPHPAESISEWKKIVRISKNIFLEKPSYDVSAAIFAADYVVHRGCTTGYQSLVAHKKPAYINLLNDKKPYHFRPTLLELSKNIKNENEFLKWLKKDGTNHSKINYNKLNKILNIQKKLSSQRIVDDFDNLKIKYELNHSPFQLYTDFEVKYEYYKNKIYDIFVKFGIKKERNFSTKYKNPKILKDFDLNNIKKILNKLLKLKIFINQKSKIRVRKISDTLFEIDKI